MIQLAVPVLGEKRSGGIMKKMKELPVGERPYEKCFKNGPEYLSDYELLSIILRTGVSGTNAYELSKKILDNGTQKGSLLSIMHFTKDELLKIKGIGKVKSAQVLCIGELAKRISAINAVKGLKFDSPATIADYYMEKMRHLEQENLLVLYLDTKCRLIQDKTISKGTVNQALISSREIFIEGLKCNAVSIILIHNHPSGDCTPSRDDISSTKNICEAGKLIGISILDHIIIGDRKYFSLKESKLIP